MSNNKSTVSLNMPVLSVEKATDILTDTYIPVIKKGISPKVLPSVMLWGPPGVGKTSSAILNSINDDFVQKTYNREKRQLALANMLMEEKAYIPKYYPEFDESLIVPLDEYKGEYEEILNKYSNAGVTFMAPNNTVFKKILQLAEAKRIKVITDFTPEDANAFIAQFKEHKSSTITQRIK